MLEVELKAALTEIQAQTIPEHLLALGFRPGEQVRELDVYLNGGGERDFRKTDEALRLRQVQDLHTGRTETRMTYKGPKLDDRSSTRMEYEITVSDLETARKLLEALEFYPAASVDKVRQTMEKDAVTVCLDRVTGLGSYLELEILQESGSQQQAVDTLLELLDTLNVSRQALTRDSYLELLEREKDAAEPLVVIVEKQGSKFV